MLAFTLENGFVRCHTLKLNFHSDTWMFFFAYVTYCRTVSTFFVGFILVYHKTVILCSHLLIRKPFFIYLFDYLVKSYRILIALILPLIFLPRDATQSVVTRLHVVSLSGCLSVKRLGTVRSHRLEFFQSNFTAE